MANYHELNAGQLSSLMEELQAQYTNAKEKGLKLDMSRGKPGKDQLDLSNTMLTNLSEADLMAEDGMECRNYGAPVGIPESRRLMGQILDVPAEQIIIGGNASLSLMHDCITFAWIHGLPGCCPWGKLDSVKFLCPAPGYDRHFAMAEHFGIELVYVPMNHDGPDMDAVEELVQDESVKGIWCVPKYSNPLGITYSDEIVRRFASLSPVAKDFRIFWDNAYAVHDLDTEHPDALLPILPELVKNGREDMVFLFTSTSKITFAGGGISAAGMSKANFEWLRDHKAYQTIGYDKINQMRHARMFPDMDAIRVHMAKHAAILQPKFQTVLDALAGLGAEGIATWATPHGGYFISLDVEDGCAKRVVELCKEAGVVLTSAGATFPCGNDPLDKNIRIAPTFPSIEELREAVGLLCLCVRLASAEKLLADQDMSRKSLAS